MKKNILPILITVLTITVIASFSIAGILIFSSSNRTEKINQLLETQTVNINDSKIIDTVNKENIEIEGVYSDIIINKTIGEKVDVSYKGNSSSFFVKGNNPELIVTDTNSSIKISIDNVGKSLGNNWFTNVHTTLEIKIPESFHGRINVNSISGNISVSDLSLDNLVTKTVSGAIAIDNTPSKAFFINTTSGITNLKKSSGSITYSSVSGDFIASITELKEKMTLKTVSGNLRITIPTGIAFNTNFSSVSGKYYQPKNYENGGQEIAVNTVSGNLNIDIE